jgi:hypothetical protein
MVDLNSSLNSFELRRDRRFDLPTPEFPSKTTLKMAMSRREEGELMEARQGHSFETLPGKNQYQNSTCYEYHTFALAAGWRD